MSENGPAIDNQDLPSPEARNESPGPKKQVKSKDKHPVTQSFIIRPIQAIFGFRKTSLTLFVLLTYLFVFILVPWSRKNTLALPDKEPHILTTSWLDLQAISRKPHPYVSHANDEVFEYILNRATDLSSKSKHITVSNDVDTKLKLFEIRKNLWNASSEYLPLHYYESSNVLIKIDGQDPKLDGVLLSAHYDSVPTAYGTTDDGTGVASLLGVLEHYATTGERPLRTVVFNFNNNEEFGLFGARAFFEHPWSSLVKYFVNLEGTGIGDRAILFRTTDYDIGKFYKTVRSPFATSIFQQGFASGLVHSETDYRIYASEGLRGFDIAFYKPRSLYHTAQDSIKYTSKNALWHMLSNTLDLTQTLTNEESIEEPQSQAVFFDLLGLYFVVVSSLALYLSNIILLIIVPIILIVFGGVIHRRKIWSTGFSWLRLPVSLFISVLGAQIVNQLISYLNPFIVSGKFLAPLIAVSSTFLLINYAFLTLSNALWPVHDFKLVITLEVFVGLWILLLTSTIRQHKTTAITGEYLFSIVYSLYSISVVLGVFGIAVASKRTTKKSFTTYGSTSNAENPVDSENLDHASESSPLLSEATSNSDEVGSEDDDSDKGHPEHNSFTYDWSLQFLILVPINLLLSLLSVELILEGLSQTVQESLASQNLVFTIILASSILLSLPLLSFAYKLNFLFAFILLLSAISSGFVSVFSDPFTPDAPLKFRFSQYINLDSTPVEPVVQVYGRQGFLHGILSDLPSVKSSNTKIGLESYPDGNELGFYIGDRPYLINGTSKDNDFSSYLSIDVLKSGAESNGSPYSPLTAEISINAKDNRYCYLSFNTTTYKSNENGRSPVRFFYYYHDKVQNKSAEDTLSVNIPSGPSKDAKGNDVYKSLAGIDEVHLHKLDWNQESYHIGLQWIPKWLEDGEEQEPADSPNNKLGIQVSCYWGEYDGVSIVDGEIQRKLPAFDELLEYSSRSISVSNRYEGLVKIDKYIVV